MEKPTELKEKYLGKRVGHRNLGVPRCRGSAASRWRMGPARNLCLIPAARAHRARFARQRARRGWAAIPGPEALG